MAEEIKELGEPLKSIVEKRNKQLLKLKKSVGDYDAINNSREALKKALKSLYESGEDPLGVEKAFNDSSLYRALLSAAADGDFEEFEKLFYTKGTRELLLGFTNFHQELYDAAVENENSDISDFLLENIVYWGVKTVEEQELIVEKHKIMEEADGYLAQIAKESEEALLEVIRERDDRIALEELKIMEESSELLDQIMKESEEALLEVIRKKEDRLESIEKKERKLQQDIKLKKDIEEMIDASDGEVLISKEVSELLDAESDKTSELLGAEPEEMSKQEYIRQIRDLVYRLGAEYPGTLLVNDQRRPLAPIFSVGGECIAYESPGCVWKIHLQTLGAHVISNLEDSSLQELPLGVPISDWELGEEYQVPELAKLMIEVLEPWVGKFTEKEYSWVINDIKQSCETDYTEIDQLGDLSHEVLKKYIQRFSISEVSQFIQSVYRAMGQEQFPTEE